MRRRIAGLFCLLSALPACVATIVGVSFLSQSVQAELEGLVHEEIEEARSELLSSPQPVAALPGIARELADSHPEVRMGWRLTRALDGEAFGDFGATTLLTGLAHQRALDASNHPQVLQLTDDRFTATARISDELNVTLVLDGSQRIAQINNFWLFGLATIALSLLISIIAARFLAWRFQSLLDAIANRLRQGDLRNRSQHEGDQKDDANTSLPSELVPIATELETMLDNVRQRASEAKVFTAGLAHELRSPLQNLIGQAEVAMLRARSSEDYQTLLQHQVSELHEFARSVDNLLFLCSSTEPVGEAVTEAFDLAEEIEVRLQAERGHARSQGVHLDVQCSGNTWLTADREAVIRAVRNLINNAIKWSQAGQTVRVRMDGSDDALTIEVHDQGPGIPTSQRERVFTPFAKGTAPSGQRAGFGLGLAMIQATAVQHRGSITIDDSASGGALMRLVLPRTTAANKPRG